jgi:hypothetical protein
MGGPLSGASLKLTRSCVLAAGVVRFITDDLARKLMRYIRLYNRKPKPIKWRYSDPSQRIGNPGFDSIGTVH